MDVFLLRVHQAQVMHQCHAAIYAANEATIALKKSDQETFWASMQNLLTAAANISKACWGPGGKLAIERAPLRKSLTIAEDSPLSSTDLRNHLEHYDERLDRWYKNSTNHIFADFNIGPRDSLIDGVDNIDIFRFFDPETNEVIFWGERYEIKPLIDAITNLLPIAEAESKKPHW